MCNKFLFKKIDNTSLVVFRIFFGFLIALEGFGAVLTGWVKRTLVTPEFTFTFMGFEWLQPIQQTLRKPLVEGSLFGMEHIQLADYTYGFYFYFFIMGIAGIGVMLGYRYRWSIGIFTVMWTCVYLMQKTSYNNHYYLLMLLCVFMWMVPAHRFASLDVKRKPLLRRISMPNWCLWIFIIQLFIVYTYASVAKMYPDWVSGEVARSLLTARKNLPIIGPFLQYEWLVYVLAYVGIAFDLLIIPLLLWKRTRVFIFCCAIVFHLFNSFVLHIGIFPYMSLALCIFFFEPKTIRNIFLKRKPLYTDDEVKVPSYHLALKIILPVYFVIQILLPLRHWCFEDNVLWTEEGHRLSWRMMLRSRSGHIQFKVEDKTTGAIAYINPKTYTTAKQAKKIAVYPDMMWQFVQFLKQKYAEDGQDVCIYVNGDVRVNGRPYRTLFDPNVDMAAQPWLHTSHHEWLLPFNDHKK